MTCAKHCSRRSVGNENLLFTFLWLSSDPRYAGHQRFKKELLDLVLRGDVDEKLHAFEWCRMVALLSSRETDVCLNSTQD